MWAPSHNPDLASLSRDRQCTVSDNEYVCNKQQEPEKRADLPIEVGKQKQHDVCRLLNSVVPYRTNRNNVYATMRFIRYLIDIIICNPLIKNSISPDRQ